MSMNSFVLWSLAETVRYFVSVNQKRKIVCPPAGVFRSKSKCHLSIFLSNVSRIFGLMALIMIYHKIEGILCFDILSWIYLGVG